MTKSKWLLNAGCLSLAIGGVIGTTLLAQNGGPAPVRVDITGNWNVVAHEDQPDYAREPGSEIGDFTGLPLNEAGRQKANAWDANILSQPERQTEAHPVHYTGNNRGPSRILKILDPATQVPVAYALSGSYRRADRVVWLDGRPHPSKVSENTRDGFSTGEWDRGAFVITTTHMKTGSWSIRRNGAAISPYAVMTEHFFRHGDYISVFVLIEDPIYLDEAMVRTYTLRSNPVEGTAALEQPADVGEEFIGKPTSWVPFWPMGTKHLPDFAEKFGLSLEATQGGRETLYPEYQLKLQQMLKDGAAKKVANR